MKKINLTKILAFIIFCWGRAAVAGDTFPDGFRALSNGAAISSQPLGTYPGFALFQGLSRMKNASPALYTATLFLVKCNGKVYVVNNSFSEKDYRDAIHLLNKTPPIEAISEITVLENELDKRAFDLAGKSCHLKSATSNESIKVPILETSNSVITVSAKTITANGSIRNAWIHTIPTKKEPVVTSDGSTLPIKRTIPNLDSTTTTTNISINCKDKKLKILQTIDYSPDGSVLSSAKSTNPLDRGNDIVPDSTGEAMTDFLCGR
jgi:hypothetical protein